MLANPKAAAQRVRVALARNSAWLEQCRHDSAAFASAMSGFVTEPFQEHWHAQWSAPGARAVTWAAVESGKTTQMTAFALWLIGRDPRQERIILASADQSAAKKSALVIKRAIEGTQDEQADAVSVRLRLIFPDLAPGDPWTDTYFRVSLLDPQLKDYSLQALGYRGNILGGRATTLILDDICTQTTTYTAHQRAEMTRWVTGTLLGRVLDGGRVILVGNAWYPDDVMHEMEARGFSVIRHPLYSLDSSGCVIPDSLLWPERFPVERIGSTPEAWRADGQHATEHGAGDDCAGCKTPSLRKQLGSVEARRACEVKPYSAGEGRFQLAWFVRAEQSGAHLTFLDHYHGEIGTAYGGVDIGCGEREGHDASAFWIYVLRADGKFQLIFAEEKRYNPPDLLARTLDLERRYAPVWRIEGNAAQVFFIAWAREHGITCSTHVTGKQKADPVTGVPGLALELEQGAWILPTGDERSRRVVHEWRTECLDWTPGQHTGDLLMASWFAREAARRGAGVIAMSRPDETVDRGAYTPAQGRTLFAPPRQRATLPGPPGNGRPR